MHQWGTSLPYLPPSPPPPPLDIPCPDQRSTAVQSVMLDTSDIYSLMAGPLGPPSLANASSLQECSALAATYPCDSWTPADSGFFVYAPAGEPLVCLAHPCAWPLVCLVCLAPVVPGVPGPSCAWPLVYLVSLAPVVPGVPGPLLYLAPVYLVHLALGVPGVPGP